jgi:bacillithiol system protein YtxJ
LLPFYSPFLSLLRHVAVLEEVVVAKVALQLTSLNHLEHNIMNWIDLNDEAQLVSIIEASKEKPQLIFKHSTRCSISVTAKSRLDSVSNNVAIDCYYLDLLNHRNISNKITEDFKVFHESPQVLLIKDGECIYDESHLGIQWDEILETVA